MDKKKSWNITKVIIKIAVTGLSLFLVFRKVDPKDLKAAILGSDHWFFVLAFLAFLCSQLISSSRLNNFFRGIGLQLSEGYNFKLYLLGMFYNIFLPGGIGGDGYKVFFLRKKFGIKGRKLVTALFFDRLSGLWAMFVITAALVVFIPSIGIPNWWPILAVVAGTLVYYIVVNKYFNEYAFWFVKKHLKAIGVQSFQVIAVIMILYALHFNGKFSPYLFIFLGSSLAALFPFTVGGLGAREIIIVYGSNFFGLDDHLAVLISLTFYLISAMLSFCGSYFIFNPRALGEEKLPQDDKTEIEEMEDLLKKDE
ncbi:hypothetical protein SAMN05216436_104122 [bacterium A37T11]|nr:hypothetical protein SAMN05216436_104122 [bacterium A37T11]